MNTTLQNTSSRKQIRSKTVVFVTGAFVSHRGWDNWKHYFENRGYKVLAPAWPHKDGDPAALRASFPNRAIAGLHLQEVVEHYAAIIRSLPEKPIIIGHSLGGLITQLLVQQGLGEAAVAIHSVAPQGVFSFEFSFLKSTWGPLGFFQGVNDGFLMSFQQWQYAFTNGMPEEAQRKAYEESVIPESRLAMREGLGKAAHIDFRKPHIPLLFVAGDQDHIMPASLNRSNWKSYKDKGSVTDFMLLRGRNHHVLGLDNWKDTASNILDWIRA